MHGRVGVARLELDGGAVPLEGGQAGQGAQRVLVDLPVEVEGDLAGSGLGLDLGGGAVGEEAGPC